MEVMQCSHQSRLPALLSNLCTGFLVLPQPLRDCHELSPSARRVTSVGEPKYMIGFQLYAPRIETCGNLRPVDVSSVYNVPVGQANTGLIIRVFNESIITWTFCCHQRTQIMLQRKSSLQNHCSGIPISTPSALPLPHRLSHEVSKGYGKATLKRGSPF